MLFGILAALLMLSGFVSGSETALSSLNRYRLQQLVKKKHRGAIKTQRLLKKPERLNGFILLGKHLLNILASVLTTLIAMRIGGDSAILPAVGLLTVAMMIFSGVIPKTLGINKPELLAFAAARLYSPLLKLSAPLIWLINGFASGLLRVVGLRTPVSSLKDHRLSYMIGDSNKLLPGRYQNMLLSILDLESTSIEEIMTPRQDILGIDLEDSIEDIILQLQNSPHTRLPVYKKNIDKVIGFIHIRTALSHIHQQNFDKHTIIENLSKPFFIPNSTSIHSQMQIFKTEKLRMCLVVDEYGDVQGLVTLDDLLQEFIGEFISDSDPSVKPQNDGSYLIDASITIRELNRITETNLPTEGPKTLNGLIIEYLESIPKAGTSIKLYGHILEIMQCDDKTVKQVKLEVQH